MFSINISWKYISYSGWCVAFGIGVIFLVCWTSLTCTATFTISAQSATQLFNIPIVTYPWIFTALTTKFSKNGRFYSVVGPGSFVTLWSASAQIVNCILAAPNDWRHTIRHKVASWPYPLRSWKSNAFSLEIIHVFIFLPHVLPCFLKVSLTHFSPWSSACYAAICWREIQGFARITKISYKLFGGLSSADTYR